MNSHPHNSSSSSSTVAAPFRSLQSLFFPSLTQLKDLTIKGLEGIKSIGGKFYGNNNNKNKEMNSHPHNSSSSSSTVSAPAPFRSLEVLSFYEMEAWEEWDWENASSSSSPAFPRLEVLWLFSCPRLKTKLPQHLPSVLDLFIHQCPQVGAYKKELPGSSYTCLRRLFLKWNHTDVGFPLYLFPNLRELELEDCRKFERLDVESDVTFHLTRLKIKYCPELVSIPQTLFFPSLTGLNLCDCRRLASIPPFTLFPSLMELSLEDCPEVEWPKPEEGGGVGFPSTLERLWISNSPKLLASHDKWYLHTLTSLTELSIGDEHRHYVDCKGWLSLPPNLKWLNGKRGR